MSDKERIDRAPVLGRVEDVTDYAAAMNIGGLVRRLEKADARATKAEAKLERLREGVKALAEEWMNGPLVGYGRNEQVELDTEKQHARTLRGLLDEGGGA